MEVDILPVKISQRQDVIDLLVAAKLPVDDLPVELDGFIIAMAGGDAVGAAGLEVYGAYGLLRSVVVAQGNRNNNIGGRLVAAIENNARANGLQEIYLLTETAQRYFTHKGYAVVSRDAVPGAIKASTEFSHVCPVSAVVMHKIL